MRGLYGALGPYRPVGVVEVYESGREHVHIGVPEADDGADVAPVTGEAVGPHPLPVCEHLGDDVLAEVLGGVGVCLVLDEVFAQLLPVEDVDAHGGEVGLGLLGLFLELVYEAVLAGGEDAEAGGLLHGDLDDGDGAVGAIFGVLAEHVGIVHLIDVVAGEDEDVFGVIVLDEADVLVDGVGGTGEPGALFAGALVGRQDKDAAVGAVEVIGLAAAYVAVELERPVLCEDADDVYAGVCAVGEREVDYPVLPAKGNAGLCNVLRERVEPRTLSAREEHCDTFSVHTFPP